MVVLDEEDSDRWISRSLTVPKSPATIPSDSIATLPATARVPVRFAADEIV
jgi:hypothetical protein